MKGHRRAGFAALSFGLAVVHQASLAAPAHAQSEGAGEGGGGEASDEAQADAPAEVPVGVEGDAYADTDPSALTDFEPALEPHGAWGDDPNYGTVWTPSPDEVGADFTPYATAGHWAYDDDYTWVSDYEWGWATFHYGRWVWLRDRGWAWIPGRQYAAAWVTWRIGSDTTAFIGWAPMAPAWGWRGGVAGALGFATPEPYVFCPPHAIFAPLLAPQLAPPTQAGLLVAQTRPYVRASPVVGLPYAPPPPRGPSLAVLGLDPARVTRITRTDPALDHARRFARPSTAVVLGGRPAMPHVFRPAPVVRPAVFARPAMRPAPAQARRK